MLRFFHFSKPICPKKLNIYRCVNSIESATNITKVAKTEMKVLIETKRSMTEFLVGKTIAYFEKHNMKNVVVGNGETHPNVFSEHGTKQELYMQMTTSNNVIRKNSRALILKVSNDF